MSEWENEVLFDIFKTLQTDRRICPAQSTTICGIQRWFQGSCGSLHKEAIRKNHSYGEEGSHTGNLDTNPVEDIEEAASLCPIDFILNVVLRRKDNNQGSSGHPCLLTGRVHRHDKLYLKEAKG